MNKTEGFYEAFPECVKGDPNIITSNVKAEKEYIFAHTSNEVDGLTYSYSGRSLSPDLVATQEEKTREVTDPTITSTVSTSPETKNTGTTTYTGDSMKDGKFYPKYIAMLPIIKY
jgi:hypothetical protein